MTYENLLIQEENNIVIITINREKALNALDIQTLNEIEHFFKKDADKHKGWAGIIITGAGKKAFAAGADIKEFLDIDGESGAKMSKRGQNIFFLIENSEIPVIAAVNGFALGGGCELAMACHLRIAGEKAKFAQPEINLGIIPGYGGTQRLTQYIGKSKAIELMLTGDMIDAHEAHRLGLVNYVVPAGQEVAKAKELLSKIATKAPVAVTKVIKCVNAYYEPETDGFKVEVRAFGKTTSTEDFIEGAKAFIEKRKPNFVGK